MAFTSTQALDLLLNARRQERLPHAILLQGSEHAGTHQFLLGVAEALNGAHASSMEKLRHPMIRVLRPSSKSRSILIKDIREVEPFLSLRAGVHEHKIVIILEAERMKEEASNAFLKTLEEPPPQTIIILVTEHAEQLLPTILSRCIRMDLKETARNLRLSEAQKLFLPALQKALTGIGNDVLALGLGRDCQELLAARRLQITQTLSAALKAEAKSIAQGTDLRDWESQQKDELNAQIETAYLGEREEMLELLSLCLGQAVLIASKAPDTQALCPEITELSQRCPVQELLLRMEGVDALRRDLKFNVNESLALDVRMLEIIGTTPNASR